MTEKMTDERLAETGTAIYNLLLAARVDPTLRKWAQTANDGFEFLRAELAAREAENERYGDALKLLLMDGGCLNYPGTCQIAASPAEHEDICVVFIAGTALEPAP